MKKAGKVSRKEVAQAAQVSESVVSCVLNGKAKQNRISDKTVERVEKVAAELGYKPNIWGKILKTQRSNLLTFVSQDLTDPNIAEIIKALGATARANGFGLTLFDMANRENPTEDDMHAIETGVADGFLVHARIGSLLDEHAREKFHHKPLFVIGKDMSFTEGVPSGEVHNEQGAQTALEHLIDGNPKTLGIVADLAVYPFTQKRLEGCKKVIAENKDKKFITEHRLDGEDCFEAGLRITEKWIADGSIPEAIFAMGDVLAMGVLSALNSHDIPCPGKVRVIGFDGTPLSKYASPQLSTLRQPFEAMAELAVGSLKEQLHGKGKTIKATHQRIPAELIVRESSRI